MNKKILSATLLLILTVALHGCGTVPAINMPHEITDTTPTESPKPTATPWPKPTDIPLPTPGPTPAVSRIEGVKYFAPYRSSREDLLHALTFNKFTDEQAEYAANKIGW